MLRKKSGQGKNISDSNVYVFGYGNALYRV